MMKIRILRREIPQMTYYPTGIFRTYHSYPDPNDRAIITTFRSNQIKKNFEKRSPEFEGMKKFSMEHSFGDIKLSPIDSQLAPMTEVTKLPNGLLVASQEKPGLMSSFSLIIAAGSSFETQTGSNSNTGVTQMLENCAFGALSENRRMK